MRESEEKQTSYPCVCAVLVDVHGSVKIADLGLTKLLDDSMQNVDAVRGDKRVTLGKLVCTRFADGEMFDARLGYVFRAATDVYALGLVGVFMLTGRMPYDITHGVAKLFPLVKARVMPPEVALLDSVPAEAAPLVAAIKACLLPQAQRITAAELAQRLEPENGAF